MELCRRAGQVLDPWQCRALEVLMAVRDDGRWACYEYAELVSRQNGKGGILEGRALAGFLLLGEPLITWSAHEYKTSMEAFRRVKGLLAGLGTWVADNLIAISDEHSDLLRTTGVLIKVNSTNGEESFERRDNDHRIKYLARSKGSGRGFTGDLVIIDEAFAYTVDQAAALEPTMTARPNPQIIYTSSPPLDGMSGGPLFELRSRALGGKDETLGYRDWGVDGDLDNLAKLNLADRSLWAAANPALGIRITEETLARFHRKWPAAYFAREFLGVWPKQSIGGGTIDMDRWVVLLDEASKRHADLAVTVDIEPNRDYAAVAMYGPRADGLGHLQLVDYREGTDWIVPRLVELLALDPVAIGMGKATFASLEVELDKAGLALPEDPEKPKRGDLMVFTAQEMSAACGQIIDAVREGTFRHIGQQPLEAAVSGAKTRQVGDGIVWSRKDAEAPLAPLVAITEAPFVFKARENAIQPDYDVMESIF